MSEIKFFLRFYKKQAAEVVASMYSNIRIWQMSLTGKTMTMNTKYNIFNHNFFYVS